MLRLEKLISWVLKRVASEVSGFQAMVWALLAIMIYIGLRFDFKYAPGAIVALFHDVVIILGVFAITDREFSLQIVVLYWRLWLFR